MGSPLLTLEAESGAPAAPPAPTAKVAPPPSAPPPPAPAVPIAVARDVVEPAAISAAARRSTTAVDFSGVFAGPAARRLARELDIDLTALHGAGDKGRITVADVKIAARGGGGGAALPEVPTVDFAKFGPIETVPLSRIKRISGPRLHASWVNVPHVTHCDDADVTELEAFRKSLDDEAKADKKAPYRVSLLPLLMKAAVATLKAFPAFNSALAPAKDALIYRHYWHIGVAVDTADGLVVAAVKDVDKKGVVELARELGALSAKAREGKLAPAEMQGATFTISSLGGIGGTAFTPIVNAPEVAILGVVRSRMAPVWDGKAFQPRLMLPLCLSYDHRVIDGAAAARFMRRLCDTATDMRRVLL
jgi:pyruvate dehydrogenase E2 component (dihydrolipoamide acetyltransferase)